MFAFFSEPANLERITPPWLGFRILTPAPIAMVEGALIDYRVHLYGLPLRWRSRIELLEPGVRFVDTQLVGPYRRWRHLHEFEDAPGGTRMRDVVEYELPLGPLGAAAHAVFVRRSLERIFAHRHAVIAQTFGDPQPQA